MLHTLNHARRVLAVAVVAGVASLGVVSSAGAATHSVSYTVQTTAPDEISTFTVAATANSTAPATVMHSTAFTIKLSLGSITVPTTIGAKHFTVTEIRGITLKIPVPANSTYVSAALSGGSNFGPGKPTASQASRVVTISVPGPIKSGTTFTLPTLALHLKAGATAGKVISTKLSGTSYTDPGLRLTAVLSVDGITVDAISVGYPSPSPLLSKTTIQ